ncbi:hypothetical protein KUV65_06745 [Maritalea mobilis]|uniref:hypothetical protein n=1 Tax=Maritalea mobilis TaxID=483324 RepID=UPI001C953A5E|nr:hypothetical protein [Maritalea mobilis]MBY6201052.1 hypothetical protein [Maritalea mobilis]
MSRPPQFPVKKLISLSQHQADQIRDYRFDERIDSETEAIRKLIEMGLEAARKQKDAG